jgi:hypothetical protein
MDARFNDFIDSVSWRVTLNLTAFMLWLAASYGLLAAAS